MAYSGTGFGPLPATVGSNRESMANKQRRRMVRRLQQEFNMKVAMSLVLAACVLSGCISSSSPAPPEKTTVVVPQHSGTTVVCQNGTQPPCN
jgi:hypothetical protein